MILYMTYWFRQRERAQAVAFFMTGLPISSIVGGPFSGMILDQVHWMGVSSWRWLLVLEAAPAIVLGILTYRLLPNRPADARFLTQSEKDWLAAELATEEKAAGGGGKSFGVAGIVEWASVVPDDHLLHDDDRIVRDELLAAAGGEGAVQTFIPIRRLGYW